MLCFCIRLYRLGKSEAWGAGKKTKPKRWLLKKKQWSSPGKKVAKILAGVRILEVGVDPGDQRAAWRQMLGDVQGPRPVVPAAGDCKQLHSKN